MERGFTLIELMVVVIIIGILGSIAMPAYNDYIQKTRRTDAKVALEAAAVQQEEWRFINAQYTGDIDNIGGSSSPEGFYTLSVATAGGGYTLTATATGKQASDSTCKKFLLTHTGARSSLNSSDAATDCW